MLDVRISYILCYVTLLEVLTAYIPAQRYCKGCDFVDAVGVPILIHRRDLEKLAPRWLQKTREMRRDRENWPKSWTESAQSLGIEWTTEMFGYVFAAAELGIRHDIRKLHDAPPYDKRITAPIIHYYERVRLSDGRTWNKKDAGAAWNIPWPTPSNTDVVSNMTLYKLHSAFELLGPSTDAHFADGIYYAGMNRSRGKLRMNHDGSSIVKQDGGDMRSSVMKPSGSIANQERSDTNSSDLMNASNLMNTSERLMNSFERLPLNHDASRIMPQAEAMNHDRNGSSAALVGTRIGVNRGRGGRGGDGGGGGGGERGGAELLAGRGMNDGRVDSPGTYDGARGGGGGDGNTVNATREIEESMPLSPPPPPPTREVRYWDQELGTPPPPPNPLRHIVRGRAGWYVSAQEAERVEGVNWREKVLAAPISSKS